MYDIRQMTRRKRQLVALLICCWLGFCTYLALQEYSKLAVKKRVTMVLQTGGSAVFVFSAAQPDNEVVYAMKTLYIPLLEKSPANYVGGTEDEPFFDFLRERLPQKLWPIALLFVLVPLGVAGVASVLTRGRRRAKERGIRQQQAPPA